MANEIIPFGKHKGQPIEVLASDKEYLEWLTSQSWFKSRYLNLYNIVINNFREPADTPEHNKMQIKFLRPEYRLKLAYLLMPNLFTNNSKVIKEKISNYLEGKSPKKVDYFIDNLREETNLLKLPDPRFEPVDVSYSVSYGIYMDQSSSDGNSICFRNSIHGSFSIEIKPTISDDFPAILRQMKASMPPSSDVHSHYILLVGSYTGVGATQTEFIQYFQTQGYIVVFAHEIDEVVLPEIEIEFKIN